MMVFSLYFLVSMLYGVGSLPVSSTLSGGARGVTEGGTAFSYCFLFIFDGDFMVV